MNKDKHKFIRLDSSQKNCDICILYKVDDEIVSEQHVSTKSMKDFEYIKKKINKIFLQGKSINY